MRVFRAASLAAVLAGTVSSGACATVAHVANLRDSDCTATFESQLSSILAEEGERVEEADALARRSRLALTTAAFGSRPFLVASPSGTDYTFFVQKRHGRCLLRLYGRQKGFWSYTNNLTYISTRTLPACTCEE